MQSKFNNESGSNGEAAPSTATPTPANVPAVPSEVRNFVADIGDLITATTSLTGADLARAKEKLIERAAAAKAALARMGSEVSERARQTARVTDDYVHDRPWQAIGIGAVLGLVIGIVLARRRG
jgi:ElaB/YqjD/DUF883 family membrane-anchored ribosome-binding protein